MPIRHFRIGVEKKLFLCPNLESLKMLHTCDKILEKKKKSVDPNITLLNPENLISKTDAEYSQMS